MMLLIGQRLQETSRGKEQLGTHFGQRGKQSTLLGTLPLAHHRPPQPKAAGSQQNGGAEGDGPALSRWRAC